MKNDSCTSTCSLNLYRKVREYQDTHKGGLGVSSIKLLVEKQHGQISADLTEGNQFMIKIKMPLTHLLNKGFSKF